MTDQELRDAYLEWIKSYCNNDFGNGVPGGVNLVLDKLVASHGHDSNVSSEQVGDLSRSFFDNDIPKDIKALLRPYRRLKYV
jgi:hypothetical protein